MNTARTSAGSAATAANICAGPGDGKQRRKTAGSRSWAGAERAKRQLELKYEAAQIHNTSEDERPATLEQAIAAFLNEKRGGKAAGNTQAKYKFVPGWLGRELRVLNNANRQFFFWSGQSTAKSATSVYDKLYRKVFQAAAVANSGSHRFRHLFAG